MAVVAPQSAPTRKDAVAAASALIFAGAEEVLLFGSVARGTAGPGSDIDLVALFADLDYSQRHVRRAEMEVAAAAVVPWPVQVHVSDRPEWRARVERVITSFEHRIADGAIVIATTDGGSHVDWDKEMVLPMSDPQEALKEFESWVLRHLRGVVSASRAQPDEADPLLEPTERELARLDRMVSICAAAAATAETAVKSLAVLRAVPTPRTRKLKDAGHRMSDVLNLLPDDLRPELAAIFDRRGVDLAVLSSWREDSTYPDDIDLVRAEADRLAPTYAALAAELAGIVLDHLQHEVPAAASLAAAAARYQRAARAIAAQDVRRGVEAPTGPDI